MILGGTGHRPNKLTTGIPDYSMWRKDFGPNNIKIYNACVDIIREKKPDKGNCGMALGFDIIWWNALYDEGIPIIAYVPSLGQQAKWSIECRRAYVAMLGKCERIIMCSQGSWKPGVEQVRNIKMSDASDEMVACWDGYRGGGTWNCVQYLIQIRKPTIYIDFKFL